jgi:hypothetical protein
MAGHADDLPFRVELWDNKDSHIEEVIALASDYATARSAYEEAVKQTRQAHYVAAEDEGHSKEPMTCNANAASSYSLRLSAMGITSLAASCNCWQSNKSAFIMDLSVGDIQALRDGRQTPHLRRRDVAVMHELESGIDQFC